MARVSFREDSESFKPTPRGSLVTTGIIILSHRFGPSEIVDRTGQDLELIIKTRTAIDPRQGELPIDPKQAYEKTVACYSLQMAPAILELYTGQGLLTKTIGKYSLEYYLGAELLAAGFLHINTIPLVRDREEIMQIFTEYTTKAALYKPNMQSLVDARSGRLKRA